MIYWVLLKNDYLLTNFKCSCTEPGNIVCCVEVGILEWQGGVDCPMYGVPFPPIYVPQLLIFKQ